MKDDAIKKFTDAVQQELDRNFSVRANGMMENMPGRIEKMQAFIAVSDEKFATLYFGLLDSHNDLEEEELDDALAALVQKHFGI